MIIKFAVLDSTNRYCLDNYKSLKHMDVVVADRQTVGRGRLGRVWLSKDAISMSVLLKDISEKTANNLVSFVMAVSVFNVLKKHNILSSIKWPNDIILNNKKICGILAQSRYEENLACLVIGVGLNTNTEQFDNSIINKATSLFLETGIKYDNDNLIEEISNEFYVLYQKFANGDHSFIEILRSNNYLLNKMVVFIKDEKQLEGVVKDIDDECNLVVEVNGVLTKIFIGEVLLKGGYL